MSPVNSYFQYNVMTLALAAHRRIHPDCVKSFSYFLYIMRVFHVEEDFNLYSGILYRVFSRSKLGFISLYSFMCLMRRTHCHIIKQLKAFDSQHSHQLSAHQYFSQHCDGHKQRDVSALDLTPKSEMIHFAVFSKEVN